MLALAVPLWHREEEKKRKPEPVPGCHHAIIRLEMNLSGRLLPQQDKGQQKASTTQSRTRDIFKIGPAVIDQSQRVFRPWRLGKAPDPGRSLFAGLNSFWRSDAWHPPFPPPMNSV